MFKKPDRSNPARRPWKRWHRSWPALIFAGILLQPAGRILAQQRRKQPPRRGVNVLFKTGRAATIPFDFSDGALVVPVRVNNSAPLKFFFDTGAGISGLSTRAAARLRLRKGDSLDVTGTGGTVGGTLATGLALSLPGVTVRNQRVVVISLDDFPCEAQDIAGFIGYDFIKEFVVEIDDEASRIRLFDPKNYQYAGSGNLFPLTLARTPRVRARLKVPGGEALEGLFEIDTGHEGTMVVNTPFVDRHKLLGGLGNQIPANGRGVGGESSRVGARLENLQLGSYTIASPVVALSLQTTGALADSDNDGPIGNEILRRFKVILDYSRQRMWLEPNAHLREPFLSDMSGIEFDAEGDNCRVFKVTDIAEKSPAAEAGIQVGDEIVAIDDRPAKQFSAAQIYQLFMVEGAEHSLGLKRANQALTVSIRLRRLL